MILDLMQHRSGLLDKGYWRQSMTGARTETHKIKDW
jgi:hypothetical protein